MNPFCIKFHWLKSIVSIVALTIGLGIYNPSPAESNPSDMSLIGLYPTGIVKPLSATSPIYIFEYKSESLTPKSSTIQIDLPSIQLTNWQGEWSIFTQDGQKRDLLISTESMDIEGSFFFRCRLRYNGKLYHEELHKWYRDHPDSFPLQISFPNQKLQESLRPELLLLPVHGVSTPQHPPKPGMLKRLFGTVTPKRITTQKIDTPNVLMILVDTLRSDHTPPYGHPFIIAPHIDMLAKLGVLFKSSYGASSSTRPSVGSIFTGLQPLAHGAVRHATDGAALYFGTPMLSETFQKAGYSTSAVSSNAQISPAFGFSRGFDRFSSSVWESQVTPKGIRQLRTLDEPFFLYLHYMGPHQPYKPFYPWKGMYKGMTAHKEQDAYAEEITIEDRRIGQILKELSYQGLLNRTLIWLVSDHGEEFWEHGWNGHGAKLYEESVQTVSILMAPSLFPSGLEIQSPVTHGDIFPTLADILQWSSPDPCQGRSLHPLFAGNPVKTESTRPIFLHHGGGLEAGDHPSDKEAILMDQKKLIWWTQKDEWEFYDLQNDPVEKKNVYNSEDKTIQHMTSLLQQHLDECRDIAQKVNSITIDHPPLSPREQENLKAHGYLHK